MIELARLFEGSNSIQFEINEEIDESSFQLKNMGSFFKY